MFTGIVETTGEVRDVRDEEGGRRIHVATDLAGLTHGDSIAVDGTCLTVEETGETVELFCSTETLARTTLSEAGVGDALNLERALATDGRLDGHFVQGHVDTTAEVHAIEQVGEDWEFTFSLPEDIARYVVEKGSIAVDGISLTVAARGADSFSVAVVPTTYEATTMSEMKPGDGVNVEVDVIAKYVERLLDGRRWGSEAEGAEREDTLDERRYLSPMYDFVVVGAGPAGSRFSRRAARAGHDVLCLERGTVGTPLACSGHVSTDIWGFTPDGAREELLQNEVSGARFHVGGPHSNGHLFYRDETISNVIDRVELDRTLAQTARAAGADLRENHSVVGVDEDSEGVTVTARTPRGTETFRARMVAGCDGPVSRVRRELAIPEPGEKLQGVLAFADEHDPSARVDVHLTVPDFFAWRIPRGEAGVEYGLGAAPGENATELFERFLDGYDVKTGETCAGMIPVGPPERVRSHRAFLVGDAAAQTKPFTGGGILYGMTAADHAAREIDPRKPATLGKYEDAWRDDLAREIRLGHWVRRAYSLPKPIQQAGLSALSGEIGVHMDKPTTLFSPESLKTLLSRS